MESRNAWYLQQTLTRMFQENVRWIPLELSMTRPIDISAEYPVINVIFRLL